jgi:hypothetical protein
MSRSPHIHDTLSLPYVQNTLSSQFLSPDPAWKAQRAVEYNVLLDVAPMLILQLVVAVLLKCRRKFAVHRTAWFQNKGRVPVF